MRDYESLDSFAFMLLRLDIIDEDEFDAYKDILFDIQEAVEWRADINHRRIVETE